MNTIQKAVDGLNRSQERLFNATDRVAKGDISAEALVETKLAVTDTRAQLKTISVVAELEKKLLDEIA